MALKNKKARDPPLVIYLILLQMKVGEEKG